MADQRKARWVLDTSTEVLERILGSLSDSERQLMPSEQYPLGGRVHIERIGYIEVKAIREEVARRTQPLPDPLGGGAPYRDADGR